MATFYYVEMAYCLNPQNKLQKAAAAALRDSLHRTLTQSPARVCEWVLDTVEVLNSSHPRCTSLTVKVSHDDENYSIYLNDNLLRINLRPIRGACLLPHKHVMKAEFNAIPKYE